MTTPFLVGFAESVVSLLERDGLVEIRSGARSRVVLFLANWLSTVAAGGSLLSHLEAALLACPEVDELYADLDQLKNLVEAIAA